MIFLKPESEPLVKSTEEMWQSVSLARVEGDSVKTCSLKENVQRVEVFLKTDGRPLNANVEMWQGPDNTPQKMTVFIEDGEARTFRATVECVGNSNAVAIRNTGPMALPLTAGIDTDFSSKETSLNPAYLMPKGKSSVVQGGAVFTEQFPSNVESIHLKLESNGRPLNARVEILQGPNNNKQVIEIFSEDGHLRPFYAIIDLPGSGNVLRVKNTSTIEFPFEAMVEPYIVRSDEESHGGEESITWT
jgi:hypothetical protein